MTYNIDYKGARWAYGLGFWGQAECPFIPGSPHADFWWMGAKKKRFVWGFGEVDI